MADTDATAPTTEEEAALAAALAADLQAAAAPGAAARDPGNTAPAPSEVGPGPRGGLQSMNPDLSVVLDAAVAAYNTDQPGALGEHDPEHSGFTLQQLELHLSSSVDPFLRMDANLVFLPHGVELEEAFATTLALPLRLQARAGQFLHRFGRINSTHAHAWNFLDQPLMLGKFFGSDGGRGIGAELSVLLPVRWYAELVGSVQQAFGNCCSRSMSSRAAAPRALVYLLALKQFYPLSDDWGLLWGVSSQTGDYRFGGRTVLVGTDLRLRWRPVGRDRRRSVTLQVEGLWRRRSYGAQRLDDGGGFAELQFTLGPSWEVGGRAEAVSGIAPRTGLPEGDPTDPHWTGLRQRYAVSTTYWPTHFSRLRLEGTTGRMPWRAPGKQQIWGLMLGLEVVVGAHGAHSY